MSSPEFRIMKDGKVVGTLRFKGALAQYSFTDADDHPRLPDGIGPDLWCEQCTLVQLVCPDKNGKPVFVGDEIKGKSCLANDFIKAISWGKVQFQGTEWYAGAMPLRCINEIELIESEADNE